MSDHFRRHLELTQQLTGTGSLYFDLRSRQVTWSPMMFELHGLDPAEPAPPTLAEYLELVAPDDRVEFEAMVRGTADHEEIAVREIRVRASGGWRQLRVMCRCQRDATGTPVIFHAAMQDVSADAERRVELIRDRESARDEARAKTRFLTRVTHELRTPLAGVIGMIDLALGDVNAQARADHLGSARASARHLLELIDDLLDASREDTWRINIVEIEFDLREVLDQAVAMVAPRARKKGLALAGRTQPGMDTTRIGDPLRLRQILVNLLYNAVKFTRVGRVDARVEEADGDEVAIIVEDTGIGIAPSQQAAVFEPFVQASGDRSSEGVGLGLAITRELVSAMGGSIELVSSPGLGTRFTVRIRFRPVLGQVPSLATGDRLRALETESSPALRRSVARSLRVLVAEDNPTNAEIVQTILERSGHRPHWVGDGEAAVAAVAAERFDVVLMDLEMPRLDGAGATQRIRAAEYAAGGGRVPVVALSAHRDAELTAAAAGMDAYLGKPVDALGLAAVLTRAATGELGAPIDHDARLSKVGGRAELARSIVGTFLSHRPTLMGPIDQALTQGRADDLHRAAHGLRGALAMVGAHRAADLAGSIERCTLPEAARLRDRLAVEIARASAELTLVSAP